MSTTSRIEWTDATWNPVTETFYERFNGKGTFAIVRLHSERLVQPLRWRKPRRVFVNSMSDLFHDQVPDEFIAKVFAVMATTPQHTYQILTKRHGRMVSLLANGSWRDEVFEAEVDALAPGLAFEHPWPLPNVWIGVSVESQKSADIRVPPLLRTPAVVQFLSCEPLLGPVDLREEWLRPQWRRIAWVIVGAESGPGARPIDDDWVRSLRDQCTAAGAAFFYKQDAINGRKIPLPELDGRVWNEYPQAMTA